MKRIFILIMFNYCCSQASGLALYGVGEKNVNRDVASISLGNSTFFSGNKYGISISSTSSMWKSALTRFTILSGINYIKTTSFPQQIQHNLMHFSILLPVGNKKVFGFGLKPAFRTNSIEIKEDYQYFGANIVTSTPIAFKKNYYINGGISEMFFQYSFKTSNRFSVGLQYSFLFGNQSIDEERYTYNIEIDSVDYNGTMIDIIDDGNDTYYIYAGNGEVTYIQNSHQFSGYQLISEGRYNLEKHEYVCRLAISGRMKVKTTKTQNSDNLVYSNDLFNTSVVKFSEFSLGYHYKYSKNSGLIMESQINYPINIPKQVALFNTLPPHEYSIHLGNYFQFVNNDYVFWNNLNIRSGGYVKRFNFSDQSFLDYGLTFGLGIEYLANTQSIDIAIRVGERESYILNNEKENYISLHFGITTGEKWFMKRRRK